MSLYIHPSNPNVGKLFPIYIMDKFKEFHLEEIIEDPNVDPCSLKIKKELKEYQVFISKYLEYNSPFHDILIFHGLGTGKTASAVNLINVLYNYNPDWNIFVILPATLKETAWFKNLEEWLQQETKSEIKGKINFISSNSPTADKEFLEITKKVDSSKKSLYIIDECHNFIHNVYSNMKSGGKKALTIYSHIINEKKEGRDVRVVCLSATPIKAEPFELSLLFNLLRPDCLPKEENKFNDLFLSTEGLTTINPNTKVLFQRRILGLVSYYIGANPNLFAKKKDYFIDLKMSDFQDNIYAYFENIEKKLEIKAKGKSKIYKTYTRQTSNFVFPFNGEKRPRPSNFKIKDEEKFLSGTIDKKLNKLKEKDATELLKQITQYTEECQKFINQAIQYFLEVRRKDSEAGHTIIDDIETYLNKYNGDFVDFHNSEQKKSKLYEKLYECSAKMTCCMFYVKKSLGKVLFYSNYVHMEGLQIFKIYLLMIDIVEYKGDSRNSFVEFHGEVDMKLRKKNLEVFNAANNIDGSVIKVILLSSAGAEGIDLMNMRTVLILEPYWDEEMIKQIVGRAIRQCSHKDLPRDQRLVEVYRFKVMKANGEPGTDSYIESAAMSKQTLKDSFLEALRESAVDCKLYERHNMRSSKYTCFNFNQYDLLRKNPGSAYRKNFEDEENYKIQVKKVKVRKIKAVVMLDDDNVSEVKDYLFDEETGIVYEYELEYPIGRISKDDKGFYNKYDVNTYIIDNELRKNVV